MDLSRPDQVEGMRRSIAMLNPDATALKAREADRVLQALIDALKELAQR